ncbi:phytoene/squalene synthase family protein [Porphyromonas gingivicanis]|uniref:phytoene/squalene synthase family protein n=1 Tax=Porphyromonas gingivicanis TaxID=266762 RepID=UPI000470A113|nr:phytoene/squalene synthase family protein [Porphyromonas gingivicanis]
MKNINTSNYQKYHSCSFEMSRALTKMYSTSFYSASSLFSKNIRSAIYSIYGFVRIADEIVDSFHEHNQKELLDAFEQSYRLAYEQGVSTNPVLHSFQLTVRKYGISEEYIEAFLSSMRADLEKKEYKTVEETAKYIYGSADVVGLMCLKVFCQGDEKLFKELEYPAMKLGSAFQKVNFLRDLQDDCLVLGRIYFPNLSIDRINEATKIELVREIEQDFEEAYSGIKKLPVGVRLAVYTAYKYYRGLLNKIKRTPAERLVKTRVRVPNYQKGLLLLSLIIKNQIVFHDFK